MTDIPQDLKESAGEPIIPLSSHPAQGDDFSPDVDPDSAANLITASETSTEQSPERQFDPAETTADYEEDHLSRQHMMSVVDHLDELRNRLFRCLAYVIVGCGAGLILAKTIMRLLEAPAGNITFQALSLEEPILVFFKVAFYAGLVLASPFILWEISCFVAPGLTRKERKILTPIVIGSPLLFVLGGMFAYFCLLGPMLHFFGVFGAGVAPINQRLDFYISLVSSILLYMGLCFQLPIIIFALSFTGLVNSSMLVSVWRYAILAATIIAAIVTPDPTAISMLIVMAALISLYFLSILLLKIFGR